VTDEPSADKFELALRKWSALDRIVAKAHEGAELFDIDDALVRDLEDACREQDLDATLEAVADFLEALRSEART
jgi:citrate lyase beta subunit